MALNSRVSIGKKLRKAVTEKYGGHCAYCGAKPKLLQIDHKKPVARGGTNDIKNLLPACPPCNNLKMTFTVDEFRQEVFMQVARARLRSVNFRTAERFKLVKVERVAGLMFYFEAVENGQI